MTKESQSILDEYETKLLKGEISPPNEFSAYIVGKLREAVMRGEALGKKSVQLKMALREIEEELLRVEGAMQAYAKDLKKWSQGDTSVVESPPRKEPPHVEASS